MTSSAPFNTGSRTGKVLVVTYPKASPEHVVVFFNLVMWGTNCRSLLCKRRVAFSKAPVSGRCPQDLSTRFVDVVPMNICLCSNEAWNWKRRFTSKETVKSIRHLLKVLITADNSNMLEYICRARISSRGQFERSRRKPGYEFLFNELSGYLLRVS
jgi:hypothetical protein